MAMPWRVPTGVLSVDGKEVASKTIPPQPPFRFTGKVDKLTIKLVPMSAAEEKLLQQKALETRSKAQ